MANLATWMRPKDEKWFQPFFAKHPDVHVFDARKGDIPLDQMDGLLLTGGSDISPEFLSQKVTDPSVLSKDMDPERDRWEFKAVHEALSRGLPILAICKGLQVFNATSNHCAVHAARRTAFQRSIARITRRSSNWATIWKWKPGPHMTASSSRFACANIRSGSLCNIIRSAVGFTTRSSRISLRDWNRRSVRTAIASGAYCALRVAKRRSALEPQSENRRYYRTCGQQYERRAMRVKAILHRAN